MPLFFQPTPMKTMSKIKELLTDLDVPETSENVPDFEESDCQDTSDTLKDLDDDYSSFEDLRYDE